MTVKYMALPSFCALKYRQIQRARNDQHGLSMFYILVILMVIKPWHGFLSNQNMRSFQSIFSLIISSHLYHTFY